MAEDGGSVWVDAVRCLRAKGIATVHLPSPDIENTHGRAFLKARAALDHVLSSDSSTSTNLQNVADEANKTVNIKCITNAHSHAINGGSRQQLLFIPPDADSAHATGFHRLGGMSRYNAMREGIVFSDGNMIRNKDLDVILTKADVTMNGTNDDVYNPGGALKSLLIDHFEESMIAMSESLHRIADRILAAMEEELELSPGWFRQHLGPFETSSQWHIKRFVNPESELLKTTLSAKVVTTDDESGTIDETILLPMHTDPSLISVVIHDSPGTNTVGAMGLQYFDTSTKQWIELQGYGHNVATVIVGSVLAHLTDGQWPAVKHRVVAIQEHDLRRGIDTNTSQPMDVRTRRRMAATLFVRPQPKAVLHVPLPSPSLVVTTDGISKKAKSDMTFETWVKRVAKNYEKKKRNPK